ncbi:hypothetical protein JW758_02460 [Candidatus Peregrinibacteria bacterium]|nr:hypothetical protein [Candidatus Peregrinibacteria bacterium]
MSEKLLSNDTSTPTEQEKRKPTLEEQLAARRDKSLLFKPSAPVDTSEQLRDAVRNAMQRGKATRERQEVERRRTMRKIGEELQVESGNTEQPEA